ncbi:MAG TPA: hypothetical protein VN697_00680 [Tepidiformaceae bacterium]|nr:hypothetical protein [Tepidiformaceae bacterium]
MSAGVSARIVLIGGVAAIGLLGYLVIRPTEVWFLLLTAALVALAVDGTVRSSPMWDDPRLEDSLVFLFLPALAVLGVGFFVDHAVDGYARPIAALVGAIGIGIIAYGEYQTVDFASQMYGPMRLLLAIATYLTAFALYTVIFTQDMALPLAAGAVGLVSVALSLELLRESRLSGLSSILIGLAIGISIAEFRMVLYFFPLDGLLAGALLIIGFYLATGLVHHLLDHDLEWSTSAEYLLVAAVGTAAVVFTRVFV